LKDNIMIEYSKEIKIGKELKTKLMSGVNKLANVVVSTLGPNGSTVIIADGYGEPYITKDGVSVSNYVKLSDPIENIAATLLKQVAQKTVEEAGDGTTTSICLAQAFIKKGFDLLEVGVPYNTLKESLNSLEEEIIEKLIESSKELKKLNIIDVATISANNDKKIGKLIQKAYNHSDIVKVEEGNSSDDVLITISGMELKTGYIDNAFVNKGSEQTIIYDEPYVMLINGKLTKLEDISKLLLQIKENPIVIVADYFSEEIISVLKDNYNRNALKVALVKSPGFAGHRKNLMEDLAIYTDAVLLNPNTKYTDLKVLGKLESIHIGRDKSIFTSKQDLSVKRLQDLKSTYKTLEDGGEKTLMNERIENLMGKIAIIKVGGNSELEMKERKDRIDDAVLSVQCALEEGIVEGGGVALFKTIRSLEEHIYPFDVCLLSPYKKIFGTDILNPDINMFEQNILDPLKVTRCALQNAVSVAKTILSTEAIVLDERLWI